MTEDERAGMNWWNNLTESERAQALRDAGWDTYMPSPADAWAMYKATFSRVSPSFVRWFKDRISDGPLITDAWRADDLGE